MTEERKRKTVLAPSPQAKRRKEESSSSSSSLPSKVFTKHNLEGVEGCIVIPDFITQVLFCFFLCFLREWAHFLNRKKKKNC